MCTTKPTKKIYEIRGVHHIMILIAGSQKLNLLTLKSKIYFYFLINVKDLPS